MEKRRREEREREIVRDRQVNLKTLSKWTNSSNETNTRNSTWMRQKEGQGHALLTNKSIG